MPGELFTVAKKRQKESDEKEKEKKNNEMFIASTFSCAIYIV